MNIKEIAKLAGVSRTTVSRVLNNTGYTRQEVKDRVLRVIQETGYIPNARAKSLRSMKADTIGVVIPGFELPIVTQMIMPIESLLDEAGFQMLITSKKHNIKNLGVILKNLIGSYVDGIILMEPFPNEEINKMIEHFPKPIVHVGICESTVFSIIHSDWNAYHKMARYLIDKGHENVAVCLSAPVNTEPVNVDEKISAIETALNEKGLILKREWIFKGSRKAKEIDGINEMIDKIFSVCEQPSAYIVDNDVLSAHMIREFKARGLRIPSDVAIISFGNTKYAQLAEPALTSCSMDYVKMGELAANTILKLINKEEIKEKHVYVEPYIIEREST